MVLGVVRSAYGVPGGMLLKPVEKVWVNAARGGAASGKESEPLAMKRAVEMGAMSLVFWGGVVVARRDVVVGVARAGGAGGASAEAAFASGKSVGSEGIGMGCGRG